MILTTLLTGMILQVQVIRSFVHWTPPMKGMRIYWAAANACGLRATMHSGSRVWEGPRLLRRRAPGPRLPGSQPWPLFFEGQPFNPPKQGRTSNQKQGSFLGSIFGSLQNNAPNFFGACFHWNQNSLVISCVPGTMVMSGELVAFSNLCFTLASNDSRTPPLVLSETWTLALDSYQIHTPFHHPKKVTSRITQRIYTVQILFQGGIFSFYVGFRGCRCSFSVFPFFQ